MDDDELMKHFAKNLKKGKAKVVAGNLLEQQREEDQKRERRLKKKTESSNEPLSNLLKKTKEDEEWEDLPEQRVMDLKNIRVGNLGLARDGDAETAVDDNSAKASANAESGKTSSQSPDVPWSVRAASSEQTQEARDTATPNEEKTGSEEAKSTPKEPEATSVGKGSYVPPQMRPKGASGGAEKPKRGANMQKPNLNDTEEFPTLGVAASTSELTEKQRIANEKNEIEQGWQKASGGPARSGSTAAVPSSTDRPSPALYQPPRPSPSSTIGGGGGGTFAQKSESGRSGYVPPHLRQNKEPERQQPTGESRQVEFWQRGGAPAARTPTTTTPQQNRPSAAAMSNSWRKDTNPVHSEQNVTTKTDIELHNRFESLTTGQE